jgi:opacity protein-like surface antigen
MRTMWSSTKSVIGGAGLLLVLGLTMPGLISVASANGWGLFDEVHVGALSVGGHATYYKPNDGDEAWYGGAQVRLHLTRIFALEALADYRRNDFGTTRTDTYPVQGSALIYLLPGRRLSPFILGGAGWYHTQVKGPDNFDDSQSRFGLHAGGGLQLWLNSHWSVDSTYRYIWMEKLESKGVSLDDKKFDDSGHMVTIGLNFHF